MRLKWLFNKLALSLASLETSETTSREERLVSSSRGDDSCRPSSYSSREGELQATRRAAREGPALDHLAFSCRVERRQGTKSAASVIRLTELGERFNVSGVFNGRWRCFFSLNSKQKDLMCTLHLPVSSKKQPPWGVPWWRSG